MPTAGKIAGTVREGATPVAACTVRLYDRTTGNLISSQSTGAYGEFLFSALDETQTENFFVVALDPAGGTQYNAMIYDRLTPVTDLSRSVSAGSVFDAVFGVGDVSFGSYDQLVKSYVPLAYWRLKETSGTIFADEMGFAPLTSYGSFTLDQPSALFDTAGRSITHTNYGNNDFLGTGKITGLVGGATGFSILAHVKLANAANGFTLLAWRNFTSGGADYIYGVMTHDRTYLDDLSYESWSWADTATRPYAFVASDDRWHKTLLTYTVADNTMRLYIDGFLVSAKVQGTPPSFPNSASVTLFNNVDGVAAQSVDCSLAEVAVFDFPLTATQAMRLAASWYGTVRLNSADKHANITLSNGDLSATNSVGSWASVRATHSKRSGRWYWETTVDADADDNSVMMGLMPATFASLAGYPGADGNSVGVYPQGASAAHLYNNGTVPRTMPPIAVGAVVGHVYDVEMGSYEVYLGGALATVFAGLQVGLYPALGARSGGASSIRFKQNAFTQALPFGCAPYAEAQNLNATTVGWDAGTVKNDTKISSVASLLMARSDGSTNSDVCSARATIGRSTGKRYFEVTVLHFAIANVTGGNIEIGVAGSDFTSYLGSTADGWSYISFGSKSNNNSQSTYGPTYTTGDVIGVCVDFDAGTLEFMKNGTALGAAYTGLAGTLKPAIGVYHTPALVRLNMGDSAFAYTPPTGFVAWNS